ncbi:MAG TPA: energy transducer TonB, partial [Bacteroidales bacterium]|nr:energy transducer TonB [Bacteroidales bacterium]
FLNQPQQKMQVAQSTPKTNHQDKSETERLTITENSAKEKQTISKAKAAPSNTTSRFTPPEVSTSENESRADELAELPKAAAPVVSQDTYEEKPLASEIVTEDKKKEETYKKDASESPVAGMSRSKTVADSPRVRQVAADEAEMAVTNKAETPIMFAEQMPEFPGGTEAMMKFISNNLVYPKTATEMGLSGKVVLHFEVDRKGKIKNIQVIRGIGGGCDEEAARVVSMMPNWIPGKQNGTAVSVYYTLNIQFSLQK